MSKSRTAQFDDDLVRLWNEIEPLRLSGDAAGLRDVERRAARIAREGDEAQRRDAERLLQALSEMDERVTATPATARLDAEVAMGGRTFRDRAPELEGGGHGRDYEARPETFDPGGRPEGAEPEEEERPRGLKRLLPLLWVLVFVVVIVLNALGGRE
jgi:hypothetical protein